MQAQMLLMQAIDSEDDTAKKYQNHVKSPSVVAAENLHRAQQELRRTQKSHTNPRASYKQSSPVKKVFLDDRKEPNQPHKEHENYPHYDSSR